MNIDRDPDILQRQMDEVLKSLGIGPNVVRFVIPGVDCPVPECEHACDRDFLIGEIYLVANQSSLAIHRLEAALRAYNVSARSGHS